MFLSFAAAFAFVPAVHAEKSEPTLQALSAEIHTQLDGLKQQSRHLTEQLAIAENELQTSSKQVETLQAELSELNTCLVSTNQKLADYSTKLTEYEAKLKTRARLILAAALAVLAFVAVRIVLLFLKVKYGIKIPYLINLLL